MTNKEYITKALHNMGVDDDDIDIILLKGGIDGTDSVDINACDTAIYNRFSTILGAISHNISEGGYSISWNIEAVKTFYTALCNELGVPNVLFARPKVRNKSNMW